MLLILKPFEFRLFWQPEGRIIERKKNRLPLERFDHALSHYLNESKQLSNHCFLSKLDFPLDPITKIAPKLHHKRSY